MFGLEFHGNGKKGIDRRFKITARAKGLFAAGHQETAALFVDEEVQCGQEVSRHLEGGNIVDDDCARSGELSNLQSQGVGDDLYGEPLLTEDPCNRIVGVFGDQEDARATCHLDPAFCGVVARMSIDRWRNAGAVPVGSDGGDAISELDLAGAVLERNPDVFRDGVAVTQNVQGNVDILKAPHGDAEDEGFVQLRPHGSMDSRDTEIVGGFLTHEPEVEGNAAGFQLGGEFWLEDWVSVRVGTQYSLSSSSESVIADEVDANKITDRARRDGTFGWSAGVGVKLEAFRFDGVLQDSWLTDGPLQLAADRGLFAGVSASYQF